MIIILQYSLFFNDKDAIEAYGTGYPQALITASWLKKLISFLVYRWIWLHF